MAVTKHSSRFEYWVSRKVDVRLPGKGNSNSHGARPVHLIITMIKWIRTSRLSIKNIGPSLRGPYVRAAMGFGGRFDQNGRDEGLCVFGKSLREGVFERQDFLER